jgi:hypothetical protein
MTTVIVIFACLVLYQLMLWGLCSDNTTGHACKMTKAPLSFYLLLYLPFMVAVGAGLLIAMMYTN